MAKAKEGDKVHIEYTGTLDDGKVFDTSKGKDPLAFKLGEKVVIPGFEKAVLEMEEGEEKQIKIPSVEAYGNYEEKAIKSFSKSAFPADKVKKGVVIALTDPQGRKIFARVKKVTEDNVTIDFNHPLAGKDLNFKIKLIKIN